MTTINETVTQSLRGAGYGQYEQYAQPVVSALVDREQQIAARLIQFAQGSDLNVDAVRSTLQDCGMHMPQAWQMPQAAFAGGGTQQGYAQQQPQQWQQGGQAPPVPQGGMTQQATPPQAQQGTGDQTADVLQRIEQTLSGLVGFARQNGYNG